MIEAARTTAKSKLRVFTSWISPMIGAIIEPPVSNASRKRVNTTSSVTWRSPIRAIEGCSAAAPHSR